MALEDGHALTLRHLYRHDRREQCLGGKTSQPPQSRRRQAAKRGEISGALVCGSSKRVIKR